LCISIAKLACSIIIIFAFLFVPVANKPDRITT